MDTNIAILKGIIGKDPEYSYAGEMMIAKFSLATSESRKKNDEWEKTTQWHSITVFGKTAENLKNKNIAKGDIVLVDGKISYSQWEKDGKKNYKTDIIANEVKIVNAKSGNENNHHQTNNQTNNDDNDDLPF
jgi:single-strand DNA-binding protein